MKQDVSSYQFVVLVEQVERARICSIVRVNVYANIINFLIFVKFNKINFRKK